jgi:hypothetical protein
MEDYINNLYLDQDSLFKFSESSNATLLSTDFAISTLNLIGKLDGFTNKEYVKNKLTSSIQKEGYSLDPLFNDYNIGGIHSGQYIKEQFTFFTLTALDILGYQVNDIPFVTHNLEPTALRKWFEEMMETKDIWGDSNRIMFKLYFLAYLEKYGQVELQPTIKASIQLLLTWLDEYQDPKTGMWCSNRNVPYKNNVVYGAAHIYLFYDYFDKEIKYPKQIIDQTLTLHTKNGLSEFMEGGACEDYDLVEIYLRLLKQTDYKKDQILEQCDLMKSTILKYENKNGGFPYKFYQHPSKWSQWFKKTPSNRTYKYSSWEVMETPIYYPDLWGSYFRKLALKTIDFISEQKNDFNSYPLPGWGFIQKQK